MRLRSVLLLFFFTLPLPAAATLPLATRPSHVDAAWQPTAARSVRVDTFGSHAATHPVQVDVLGPQFSIGGTPRCSTAPDNQEESAVIFGGANYLVVWQDDRTGSPDIYGARLSPEGEVLDSCGIQITTAPEPQTTPAVGFDGTNYLVVWQDTRNNQPDIYGARVTPEGLVLDADGIAISTYRGNQTEPAVAFDGTNYLVVWSDSRLYSSGYENEIFFSRVTPEGVVLDPDGVLVNVERCSKRSPAVAFGEENFLVVWNDSRQGGLNPSRGGLIYGSRISRDGVVIDSGESILISWRRSETWHPIVKTGPAVAFDGVNYFVVWPTSRGISDTIYKDELYGARVTTEGLVLDPYGLTVSITPPEQLSSPAIAFCGGDYLVAWAEGQGGGTDVRGTRVTVDGIPLDVDKIEICEAPGYQAYPAIAFDGANCLVTWCDARLGGRDVCSARVSGEGFVLDSEHLTISTALPDQSAPAVAFGEGDYFVAWQERRGEGSDICGARVRDDGVLLDTSRVTVSAAIREQTFPAIAFDGTNYLIVWEDTRNGDYDIYGARVNIEGVVLEPEGVAICTAPGEQRLPVVASSGSGSLVVWEDLRNRDYDIFGTRVDEEGIVLDSDALAISTAAGDQRSPAVGSDGSGYLVAWRDERGEDLDVYGARVDSDGTPLDGEGFGISTAARDQTSPGVVFGAGNYFVTWDDGRRLNTDLFGARVTSDGAVLDSLGLGILTDPHYNSTNHVVAYDGHRNVYAIAWEESRSGSFHVYRTEISATGPALGPSGALVSTTPHREHRPSLAIGDKGRLIAYGIFSSAGSCRSFSVLGNLWRVLPTLFAYVTATVENGRVVLSWQMEVGVSECSFLVERSESAGGEFCALDAPVLGLPGQSFSCIDSSVEPARTYWYRITVSTAFGEETYGPIGAAVPPVAFRLHQSYPNPFNPVCTIRCEIPQAGRATLWIFDVSGSSVRTLVDCWREPGVYNEVWDGRAEDGSEVSSGVYFYQLTTGGVVATRKAVLLR